MRSPISLTLIVFLLSPCGAGIFLLVLTTIFYEEQETLVDNNLTQMFDIRDMDHMDVIYIVIHGWKDTSDGFGSIYVLMVLVKYHKVQGRSKCCSACCWYWRSGPDIQYLR